MIFACFVFQPRLKTLLLEATTFYPRLYSYGPPKSIGALFEGMSLLFIDAYHNFKTFPIV